MSISRRRFIQLSSLASASVMMPQFLKAFEHQALPSAPGKILVVIQLSGGNDGLNTVIPYRNDIYYSQRPLLGIKREDALSLDDDTGLHPSLKGIKGLYDNGYVSIINGVGYPEPDRSHFRSMDIWHSASGARNVMTTGWLGRYLDGTSKTNAVNAIEVDDTLSLALKGEDASGLAISDIKQFHNAAANGYIKKVASHADEHDERLAGYLYKTLRQTTSSADYVYDQSRIYTSAQQYPDTPLGKRMKTIGALICSHAQTKVYYVSHGSFDTHVGQKDRQEKLLEQLDGAVTALTAELKANNMFNDVLIVTFSEFGRRVSQNASNGTDHGTAGNMFVISGGLKKQGLYNKIPDLVDLDEGDLKHTIDFRDVYATLLKNWLDADPRAILGKNREVMNFI